MATHSPNLTSNHLMKTKIHRKTHKITLIKHFIKRQNESKIKVLLKKRSIISRITKYIFNEKMQSRKEIAYIYI